MPALSRAPVARKHWPTCRAAALAEECYKSQYTPEVMKAFNAMMEKVLEGNIYLRLALSQIRRPAEVEHDLYVGVP